MRYVNFLKSYNGNNVGLTACGARHRETKCKTLSPQSLHGRPVLKIK